MSPSRNKQTADPKNISDSTTANPKNILNSKTADPKNILEENQDKWKSVTEEDGWTQPFIYTDCLNICFDVNLYFHMLNLKDWKSFA